MKLSETTGQMIHALTCLRAIDLEKLFASGFDVTFHSYTEGKPDHMPRVTIHAEDAAELVEVMEKALQKALIKRRSQLVSEIGSIRALDLSEGELP